MNGGTIGASLMAYMRWGACACAFAVFSVVSAPTLLADSIYNFDFRVDSDALSSTPSGSAHPEHDFLIFKESLLSEESSLRPDPSFDDEDKDRPLHKGSLADVRGHGLHLGWGASAEHRHKHHPEGGPTNGNTDPPNAPVAAPEPSTNVALLSGGAIFLLFSSRRRAQA